MFRPSLIFAIVFLNMSTAFGFDEAACDAMVSLPKSFFSRLILYSSSTFSFSTSSGDCAALGLFHQRDRFIYANYDQLRRDSARGDGEYLTVLSSYYGCVAPLAKKLFFTQVQNQYGPIFKSGKHPLEIHHKIQNMISIDKQLRDFCQVPLNKNS